MNVGAELAAARERLGLSRDDVSQRTKISVERLLAIEQEDVQNLPPMVYLKGFVREYATAVELDPQEITERYLSGLDDPAGLVSARPTEPQAIDADPAIMDRFPEEAPVAAPPREPPRVVPTPPAPTRAAAPPPVETAPPRAVKKILLEVEDDVPPLEKEVRPAPVFAFERPTERSFRGAPVAVVVVLAVVVGFLLSANAGRIWPRATSPQPAVETKATPEAESGDPQRAVATQSQAASGAGEAVRARREREVPPAAAEPTAPARAEPLSPVPPTAARAPGATAAATTPAPPTARGLTGAWTLTTRIEKSSETALTTMNGGYRVQLQQDGDRITGRGIKWMENGKPLTGPSRVPIVIEGARNGQQLELRFTEQGGSGRTSGTITMTIDDDGTLRGQFSTSAGDASGSSIGRRAAPEPR